ncbi:MAG: DUF2796 domain-containing protein [Bacteriovorax sp.]|nr:DUF2796 domain-containing protein [Bacteriovorax sp.]
MKKMALLLSLLLVSNIAHSETHGRRLGAHVHGTIKIEMAVEGKSVDLSIDGPAESFVGYEYTPKSAKEKKAWAQAVATWNKQLLSKLFIFDKSLGCKINSASFRQEMDEEENKDAKKEAGIHSDINAEAKVTCAIDLAGQSLVVALKKNFPKIKKLAVELVGTETKTIDINSDEQTIKL